jgi:serine/threonine protein kinase
MAAPANTEEFLDLVRKSGVTEEKRLDPWLQKTRSNGLPAKASEAAGLLVRDGILTTFQAEQILQGKWRRFTIGKYKVLEKLGSGGMGSVYLCEHKLMRRRVAVKVLPTAKAADESSLQRFYREARAVAALDHPHIVHAYDIDNDDNLHFLVMEYVDGASFQELVKKIGPIDIIRACHYIRAAALGLEHASQAGLIHRDIKPGNILVDRTGVVKILDMGLARFFNDEDDVLTKKFDENVLGTADYLAPEQAQDSHTVDIRADIYSLGATFYYLLTGRTIFGEGTVAQKLMWHMSRVPKPVTEFRPEVPAELSAILQKMLAKEPSDRFQTPGEVAAALEPFTQTPIEPPADREMPQLSLAATGQTATGQTIASQTAMSHNAPQLPSLETAETAVVKRDDSPGAVPKALQGMSSKAPLKTNPAPPASTASAAPPAPSAPSASNAPAAPAPPPSRTPPTPPGASKRSAPRAPGASGPSKSPKPKSSPRSAAAAGAKAEARSEPAPVQTLTSPAAESDESAFWESLGSVDTADPSAKADTAPQPAPSAKRLLAKDAVKNKRRAWLIFGSLAIAAGVLLISALVYVVVNRSGPTAETRRPLEVSREGDKRYRSVFQALLAAKAGDVIHLTDEVHKENLLIEPKLNLATDVTVQAAPGKEVVWKSASPDDKVALLTLQHAARFKVKGPGLTFDGTLAGGKRVRDLIVVNFEAPGLTIDDVALKNFGRSGVNVMNAWGNKAHPIRLVNLSASATPPPVDPKAQEIDPKTQKIDPKTKKPVPAQAPDPVFAALLFDANPDITHPPYNDFMEIGAVHIEGGLKTAIKAKDNTVNGKNIVWPQ